LDGAAGLRLRAGHPLPAGRRRARERGPRHLNEQETPVMTIRYALFENNLTSDPDDYAAQVDLSGSSDLEDIVRRMLDQGSTVTEADIRAVLADAIKATQSLLLDGRRVNFGGLCDLYPRIRGKFTGPADGFDPARHKVDVGASPGAAVRSHVRAEAQVEKVEAVKPAPSIVEYRDLASGEANGTITPGTIGTLVGHRLKYNAAEADEGIFILPQGGGTIPQVKVELVRKNSPAELVFIVPALPANPTVLIEVRARVRGGEQMRSGRLDALLTKAT